MAQIESFVASKKPWIAKMHSYYERIRAKCGGYEPNAIFYLGRRYAMRVTRDRQTFASVSDSMKMITFHAPTAKAQRDIVKQWYKGETTRVIAERLPILASKMGLSYNKVTIKEVTSRWASCSRNGNLSFSLLLSAAPLEVIEYVIIHELAHLVRMDHSAYFWKVVSDNDTDYKRHRKWLSDYAPVVRLD
jgi:predicted metal-dependent hydrolase